MKVLLLGASGATGKLVAMQLINRKINIRIAVRKNSLLLMEISESPFSEVIRADFSNYTEDEMRALVKDCSAVISCLGHNMSFKGIFGKPHYLVYSAIKKICESIDNDQIKLILMSTIGYSCKGEKISVKEKIIIFLVGLLLPPQRDNERAAEYLINYIGTNKTNIEWTAVRPDTLIDEEEESNYEVYYTPLNGIFSSETNTSRINVSHFMAELVSDNELWDKWKYELPVIYNEFKSQVSKTRTINCIKS